MESRREEGMRRNGVEEGDRREKERRIGWS